MDYIIYLMGKGGKERNESAWKHIHINSHKKKKWSRNTTEEKQQQKIERVKSLTGAFADKQILCATLPRDNTHATYTRN